jgi:hypothetical protein
MSEVRRNAWIASKRPARGCKLDRWLWAAARTKNLLLEANNFVA